MVFGYVFTFQVLANQAPTGKKSQNTGVSGHFGLGRPLAPRLGWKQKNATGHIETKKREQTPFSSVLIPSLD